MWIFQLEMVIRLFLIFWCVIKGDYILCNLSGIAKSEKLTAIIGPSGSGKSTLLGIKISEITRQRQKEAWKESAMKVRELTSGIECYMWETTSIFGTKYRTVNDNSRHNRPIKRGESKGLNFIRIWIFLNLGMTTNIKVLMI